MWGKFETFFLGNLDIAALAPRPKLPECLKQGDGGFWVNPLKKENL